MTIIKVLPEWNNGHCSLDNVETPLFGWVELPDEFADVWAASKPFVEITVDDDGTMTAMVPVEEIVPAVAVPTEAEIREKRDQLLAETDWTQVLDAPLSVESAAEFRTYRQALRDITEQEGFPADVVWPEMPTQVKVETDEQD